MHRTHWLLLFVAASPDRAVDPVRLQKGLFLLAMGGALPPDQRYVFEPYAYGPMSRELYRDIRALGETGLLESSAVPGRDWQVVELTPAGRDRARELLRRADPIAVSEVATIRTTVDALDFDALLSHVYARYPAYAVRSVFRPS